MASHKFSPSLKLNMIRNFMSLYATLGFTLILSATTTTTATATATTTTATTATTKTTATTTATATTAAAMICLKRRVHLVC